MSYCALYYKNMEIQYPWQKGMEQHKSIKLNFILIELLNITDQCK